MRSQNVRRDDDYPLFTPNNDVTRDEFDEHEAEFEAWKEHIHPAFQARMLAVAAALVGRERCREFYEATFYEAFIWTLEAKEQAPLDTRIIRPGESGQPR